MDELSAFKNAPRQMRQRETALLKSADLVVTGGPRLYEAKRDANPNVLCLPSAVDAEHYSAGARRRCGAMARAEALQGRIAAPRLGFFGVIDERLDLDLVAGVADADPAWQIVMVGPGGEDRCGRRCRAAPTSTGSASSPTTLLPQLVAGWDVCLMPFALNESTAFISPTKTLEYMAAGKPVVVDADPRRPGDVRRHRRDRAKRRCVHRRLPQGAGRVAGRKGRARDANAPTRVRLHSWDAAAETIRRSLDAVLVAPRASGPAAASTTSSSAPGRIEPASVKAGRNERRRASRRWPGRVAQGGFWGLSATAVAFAKKFPATSNRRAGDACDGPQNRSDRDRRATGERFRASAPQPPASAQPLDLARRPVALPLRRRAQVRASVADRSLAADDRGAVSARVAGQRHRRPGLSSCCWYERDFELEPDGGRVILRFGAVDYAARVWVNGQLAATHEGGHTPFSADITSMLDASGRQRVTVMATTTRTTWPSRAASRTGSSSRTAIWYPRTTGIWQTVWLERVAATYIDKIRWTPHVEGFAIALRGAHRRRRRRRPVDRGRRFATASACSRDDRYQRHRRRGGPPHRPVRSRASTTSATSCCGARSGRRCSTPRSRLLARRRRSSTRSRSYTALRSVDDPARPLHAERPPLPAAPGARPGLLARHAAGRARATTPCGATSSSPRRWASTACASTRRSRTRATCTGPTGSACWCGRRCRRRTASRATRDQAHGARMERGDRARLQPSLHRRLGAVQRVVGRAGADRRSQAQRHAVEALYHLTKTLDATRPVIGNDGWESSATDIIGIHDYDAEPEHLRAALRRRDQDRAAVRPAPPGRPHPDARRLSASRPADHADRVRRHRLRQARRRTARTTASGATRRRATRDELRADAIAALMRRRRRTRALFSGFCYTQFADTFQEANGLLRADRTPKIPLERRSRRCTTRVARMHIPGGV